MIVAPQRNLRPDAFADPTASHKLELATSPAIEMDPSILEIKDEHGRWAVKVVGNSFAPLTLHNSKAYGKQEVVIETPQHNVEFSELPLNQIMRIFQAFISRRHTLYQLPGIRYVVMFKNDGPKAGASIAHAHSQIIAVPFIPPTVENEAAGYDHYLREHSSCPLCDVVKWELSQKVRVIHNDRQVLAIAPYAASAPFGAWIIPKRHVGSFAEFKDSELLSTAKVLKQIAAKLDGAGISFNFFLQDSLPAEDHHFVLKVEPRSNTWGGFELATGVILNPVPPEFAARWYKSK